LEPLKASSGGVCPNTYSQGIWKTRVTYQKKIQGDMSYEKNP